MKIIHSNWLVCNQRRIHTQCAGKEGILVQNGDETLQTEQVPFRAQLLSSSSSLCERRGHAAAERKRAMHAHMHTHKLTCAHSYRLSLAPARVIQPDRPEAINLSESKYTSQKLCAPHFLHLLFVFLQLRSRKTGPACASIWWYAKCYWVIPHIGCIMRAWTADRFLRYAKWEELAWSVLRPDVERILEFTPRFVFWSIATKPICFCCQ